MAVWEARSQGGVTSPLHPKHKELLDICEAPHEPPVSTWDADASSARSRRVGFASPAAAHRSRRSCNELRWGVSMRSSPSHQYGTNRSRQITQLTVHSRRPVSFRIACLVKSLAQW